MLADPAAGVAETGLIQGESSPNPRRLPRQLDGAAHPFGVRHQDREAARRAWSVR